MGNKLKLLKFPEISPSERLSSILKELSETENLEQEHAYLDTLFIVLINYLNELEGQEYEFMAYDLMKLRAIYYDLTFTDL